MAAGHTPAAINLPPWHITSHPRHVTPPAACLAEFAAALPGTPMAGAPLGGAAAASPEGGEGADAASKRRLSGLRRLRSALQEFASALSAGSSGAGSSSGAGMRP